MKTLNSKTQESFREGQDRYFNEADTARFFWQTRHPFVSPLEKELLPALNNQPIENFLEIGCGEGANLTLMSPLPSLTVGVDLYLQKLQFARGQLPGTRFAASDAASLPFGDRFFDYVLLRDLLHHLVDPHRTIQEAHRVLRPGGTLVVIETNGKNPFTKLFALRVPEERKVLQNHPRGVLSLLDGLSGNTDLELRMAHPFPLHRALLHYRFGLPWLTRMPFVSSLLKLLNWVASKMIPQNFWYYIIVKYKKN